MSKSRLEAFSDGVFAIIITIMVLELKVPASGSWRELTKPLFVSTLSAYFLSFLFIASFWISHHTIIAPVETVDRLLLWTNNALLFPISLLPLVTAWHGEFPDKIAPSIAYISIYVLSVIVLYILGQVSLKRTVKSKRAACYQGNRLRLWLSLFGLFAILITLVFPAMASITVLGILIFWLINSSRKKGA